MPKGYWGKILRVDLSHGTIRTEEYPEEFYRTYFGGRGFNAYFLMREVGAEVDALSPENRLIFSMGPLTGGPFSGSGRSSVGAKSPLTGGYGEGDVGGFMGAELKHAGFDAIIFEGKAQAPVYLWVHDGEAELRDASKLWGLNTRESQSAIRDELGDQRIRTAQIGPGGENLVRFACIINDLKHAAGRSGMGAVMGSKNLKAVAVRGKLKLELAEPEKVSANAKWMAENYRELAGRLSEYGTSEGVMNLNETGGLPTRNFQTGVFEHANDISGDTMHDTILVARENCYACVLRCKRAVKVEEADYQADPIYGGPEYETIGSLGSLCGIGDLRAISHGNQLCNAYSIDTIAVGTTIAFAMECYERGLITKADTGGIDLKFGNAQAMVQMIEKICRREGFGAVLAEGTMRAAAKIGKGAIEYAMQIKGQEFPMHEPRIKQGLGVGYSVSPTGTDHCHNIHDTTMGPGAVDELRSLGMSCAPLKFDDIGPDKMTYFTYRVNWSSFGNCDGMCMFIPWSFDQTVELVKGVTGWNANLFELMKVGERMNTLCRAYNVKCGMTAKDDTLPKRFFEQIGDPKDTTDPLDEGEWRAAKQFYYKAMGWNEEGVPTKAKLQELGLGWVAEDLDL
jgi:aldehyde:ferredoxin oxidoreductase